MSTIPELVKHAHRERRAQVGAVTLINDLDLKIVAPDGSVTFPWVGDAVTPENGSTRGVNDRDSGQ